MLYVLMSLLLIPAVSYYGIGQQITLTAMELASGLLLGLLISRQLRRNASFLPVPALVPLLCYCTLLLFQIIPLPPALLSIISPTAYDHYQQSIWLLSPGDWMPVSIIPRETLFSFFRFSSYTMVFFATVQILNSSEKIKKAVTILSYFGGLYAFLGLLQVVAPSQRMLWLLQRWPDRTSHPFASYINGNHYSGFVVMLLPLAISGFYLLAPHSSYGSWRQKVLDLASNPRASMHIYSGLSAILIAVSVFFSLSRGGILSMLAALVALFILLFFRLKDRQKLTTIIPMLILIVGLTTLLGWEPILERFGRVFNSTGQLNDLRPVFWRDSLQLIRDFPILGSGHGSFIDSYQAYQSRSFGHNVARHAHNDYLEILTDTGFFGLLVIACFLFVLLRKTWKEWQKRHNRTARYLYCGTLAALVAPLSHAVTDFNISIPPNGALFFFFCGLLVATANVRSSQSRAVPQSRHWGKVKTGSIAFAVLALTTAMTLFNGGTLLAQHHFSTFDTQHIEGLEPALRIPAFGLEETSSSERYSQLQAASYYAPFESDYRFAQSIFLTAEGSMDKANTAITKAIKLRPFSSAYLQKAALLQSHFKQETLAEKLFTAAIKLQPVQFSGYQMYADWLLEHQRSQEALTIFRQGLEVAPKQTQTTIAKLDSYNLGYLHILTVIPEQSKSWQLYAEYLAEKNLDNDAISAYQKATSLATNETPPKAGPFWSYTRFLKERDMKNQALAVFLDGIKAFPSSAGFHSNAGRLYEQQGINFRAIEEYQQALLLDPKIKWVRNRLNHLTQKKD